jgi:hypothetical protein
VELLLFANIEEKFLIEKEEDEITLRKENLGKKVN